MPDRASHGSAVSDAAGTETDSDKNSMLYYHRVGTPQCQSSMTKSPNALCFFWTSVTLIIRRFTAEDFLVHKDDAHPEWMWGTQVTEVDGKYLILNISQDTARVRFETRIFLVSSVAQTFTSSEKSCLDRRSRERPDWTEPAVE